MAAPSERSGDPQSGIALFPIVRAHFIVTPVAAMHEEMQQRTGLHDQEGQSVEKMAPIPIDEKGRSQGVNGEKGRFCHRAIFVGKLPRTISGILRPPAAWRKTGYKSITNRCMPRVRVEARQPAASWKCTDTSLTGTHKEL
jgi:hypothetical protein